MEKVELLEGMETVGEGGMFLFTNRVGSFVRLLKTYKPKYIVEIGFNLGHSCKVIIDTLTSLEDYSGIEKIYVFDICEGSNNNVYRDGVLLDDVGGKHDYVEKNFEIMKKHYGVDMELIVGDTLETLKPFIDKLYHELDFVEVDGFHEGITPKLDIESTIGKLKVGGVLYIDDYNNRYPAIKNAVESVCWDGFEMHFEKDIFYAIREEIV